MTQRQKRFVEEYLVDLNASAAAKRAGYRGQNTGYLMLRKPHVHKALEEAIQQRSERNLVRQDEVVKALREIAFSDASDETGAKVKLGSKLRALELLGKHLGMFRQEQQDQEEVVIVDDLKQR